MAVETGTVSLLAAEKEEAQSIKSSTSCQIS